jgi:prolyl-tRNA synthetase
MDYRIVSAVSGAMGGSASEEFLAPAPTGEDTFVQCTSCDYAANTEAVELRAAEPRDPATQPPLQVLDTPDTPTIDTLVAVLADLGHPVDASGTLKNVVVLLRFPDGKVEPLVVGVPGDREVDVKRLEANVTPAEVLPFDAFEKHPQLVKGYIGPQGLKGVRYVVDPLVVRGSAWATGANEQGKHAVDVVLGRDFEPADVVPAAEVRAGDPCGRLRRAARDRPRDRDRPHLPARPQVRDAFGLDVLGPEGKPVRVTMGSYGIGVSRAIAALAEQSHDDRGLVWPRSVAPVDVHLVGHRQGRPGRGGRAARRRARAARPERAAGRPAQGLPGRGVQGRELLGIPTSVVVGKALADGQVELKDRRSGEVRTVPVDDVVEAVVREVRA